MSTNTKEKTRMSDDFDIVFESPSPCCGEAFSWVWDESELHFTAECGCMKRYNLLPATARVEHDPEDFDDYEE